MKDPKFYIVVTGHNCAKFVKNCIRSIEKQTYQNFEVVFVSDGSTDSTAAEIVRYIPNDARKYEFKIYKEQRFAAFRRFQAILALDHCGPESIIITVDLDDQLHSNALEVIKNKYESGNIFMTYGNWINQNGVISPAPLYYSEEEIRTRTFRRVPYQPVSPNTFRKKLWNKIPWTDYIGPDGKWLEVCTETGFRLSCLELCGMDRVGIIEEPIYKYNASLPGNTQRKHGQEHKNKVRDFVFSQPKKNLYEYQDDITMPSLSEIATLV